MPRRRHPSCRRLPRGCGAGPGGGGRARRGRRAAVRRRRRRHPARASRPPARLGPSREGRIQAAANDANTLARSCSGSAWATSTMSEVSMRASAAPETARPATKTVIVGASAETTCAATNRPMPHRSTGRGPTRSVQLPDHAMATVKVTRAAPIEAPKRDHPSRSRTTVGRIVMTARFSNAARVTRATIPTTTGRLARSRRRTGASGPLVEASVERLVGAAAGSGRSVEGAAVPEVVMHPSSDLKCTGGQVGTIGRWTGETCSRSARSPSARASRCRRCGSTRTAA